MRWEVAESAEPRTSPTGKKVTERGNEEIFGENYKGSEKIDQKQRAFQNWLSAE